ncbi:S-layer homology domain-containing protein [Paenibacillus sp. 19GGS1-52]|uniref:S-layer homology domain-containing protein n=1 Tax=Paenibacillus sp. 19GGS1-52 TaxID=2758563 RepID=UPI001EFA3367|nr:S-layer homology domain-containing protein [Paenibacillus sp. 19GGS1-52]ULO05929.1 S-layer homology domain-containing protein [Paenibacillus sp. 19GGS1-52]
MNTVFKKGISIILVLLMVMGGISGVIVSGGGTAYAAGGFAGGTGAAGDPYQIATADQLDLVRDYLGAGLYFKLTADIDLSSYANWEPIGYVVGFPFKGRMDGNGYTITNLKLESTGYVAAGLFGAINQYAEVSHMILEDVEVKGQAVGGLAGMNNGTISNSHVTGHVSGSSGAGGLVSLNNGGGTISNSYATVTVNGILQPNGDKPYNSGGLAGINYGTIDNSYATGSVSGDATLGGLVGNNSGTISNSYATGSVSGDLLVGGLVGFQDDFGTISNSYATGSVSGTASVGGLVGFDNTTQTPINSIAAAIAGISAPIPGDTPVSVIKATAEYTATISWSPTTTVFDGGTEYIATIIITPDSVHTLKGVPKNFFTVDGAITTNEAGSGVITAIFPKTLVPIAIKSIEGVTAPVAGETPVSTITDTEQYTASLTWFPGDAIFARAVAYTAMITITPKAGYTLTSVPANFFTVAGATTKNGANSNMVYAEFPATAALPIATGAIIGVTAPVAGETPVAVIADTAQYTASLIWSPVVDAKFAGAEIYTATITITPKLGYTLTGVPADAFTVAGAITKNDADSGVITAKFPATAAVPIATGAIVGVTAPIAGVAPVTTIADTAQYTASLTWSPAVKATFAGAEIYTATITISPKAGYTLIGVPTDAFTVAGSTTTTNDADSGVITAKFPATAAIPITTGAIVGVTAPIAGSTPVTTIADTAQYTAAITWSPAVDTKFAGVEIYTATITLTPKAGYTLKSVPANFFTVAGATTKNDADSGVVIAEFPTTAALPIATGAIGGVTVPVTGATPVTMVTNSAEYTATLTWLPTPTLFMGGTAYTALIIITPRAGYTLTGVPANFFTVAGATTKNGVNSGVVTAEFPATEATPVTEVPVITVPIATARIAGVTAPVTGATPVTTVTYSAEYTATLSWLPTTTLFVGGTAYTALIIITPRVGYTLTGVPADFFTVAGATTTNGADSGVVVVGFPATEATPVTEVPVTIVPITTAGIAGVTAPVTGATPVTMVTYSAEYTATLTWLPTTTLFVGETAYTALIIITPRAGHTLAGVPANFFTVAGATTTNAADSGIVMAVFPATQPVSTGTGTGTGTGSTSITPSNPMVTSTNGTLTLPLNQSGEVNFEDAVKISIPVGAIDEELKLTIDKVLDTQRLLMNNEILLSPVFEMLKNFSENFNKPVTLNFTFDPSQLKSNQKASVFYYDELKKVWVEIGGKISGNKITVDSNHFTKFAVLAVDEATEMPTIDVPTEINFSDVAGHWAEASIKQAVSIGMVKGYLDGTFQPNRTVTRAEFAVMLMNVLKTQDAGAQLTFTDTAKIGAWAQTAIAQAVQAGMITGYEDGAFRPNAEITRAEMAVILAKALGKSTEVKLTFRFSDDLNIPAWAKSSVEFVTQAGIVQGKGHNEFAPQDPATRAEAVTVLLKILAQLSN